MEERNYTALAERLGEEHPALLSSAAFNAMTPVFNRVVAVYGPEAAADIEVIRAIYNEVGGDARFAGDHFEEQYVGKVFGNLQSGGDLLTG